MIGSFIASSGGGHCRAAASHLDNPMPSESIVVVDSEPIVRNVMSEILRRAGYQVRATGEPDTAFEMVRQQRPDLVITNVFLRGSRSRDVMQRLRSEIPNIRILLVSGLPDDEVVRTVKDGFDAFPKPFTAQALNEKVREVLTGEEQFSA
jgi:CheY-like chemotaxis protein